MGEGGYPAIGTGGPAESPLPAGYGSLDEGFPPADPDAVDRRRGSRSGPAAQPASPAAAAGAAAASGDGPPLRPWSRRLRPPPAPEAPRAAPKRTKRGASPGTTSSRAATAGALAVGGPPASPPGAAPPGVGLREGGFGGPGGPNGPGSPGRGPLYEGAEVQEGPVRGTRRPHQKVQVVRGVRSRRLVRRVDVWTVFKVSLVFYLLALLVLVVTGIILWNVASAFGFITSIEKSVRTLFSLKTFVLHPGATLAYGSALGAVVCVVGVLINVIAAITYNLISDLVGGVQVVVVSETD